MSRIRIAWRFAADYGTVTSNTENYEQEPANLIIPQLAYDYRTSLAGTSEWIKVDLGQTENINFLCLYGHNFDNTETGKYIEGNGTDSWGSPSFQQAITHRAEHMIEFFATQTLRWWRIPWTKAAAADPRSISRLMLGSYTELTRNPSYGGLSDDGQDLSTKKSNKDGANFSDAAAILDRKTVKIQACSQAIRDELAALWTANGERTPFLISEDHENIPVDGLIYGTMKNWRAQKVQPDGLGGFLWDVSFSIMEEA